MIGKKAEGLNKILQYGCDVPAFLCVPCEFFFETCDRAGIARSVTFSKSVLADIRDKIDLATMGHDIVSIVKEFMAKHSGARFAVRSSSLSEDSSVASFAGIYKSFLNLCSLEQVLEEIKSCWKSQFDDSVTLFSDRITSDFQVGMGVVVQVQIQSVSSGVAFSRNPVNGEHEVLIESVEGQGEAVVSGAVVPDKWCVKNGVIVSHVEVQRNFKIVCGESSGLVTEEMSGEKGTTTFSDVQALRLAEIVSKLENSFGYAVDVEWAVDEKQKIWLLQARPITNLESREWDPPFEGHFLVFDKQPLPMIFVTRMCNGLSVGATKSAENIGALEFWTFHSINQVVFVNVIQYTSTSKAFDERNERAANFLLSQCWRKDWESWKLLTLDVSRQLSRFKSVPLANLNDLDLEQHLTELLSYWEKCFEYHHIYSDSYCVVTGRFLSEGTRLCGCSQTDLLALFSGRGKSRAGPWSDAALDKIKSAFGTSKSEVLEILSSNQPANEKLGNLLKLPCVGDSVASWLFEYDHYLLGGEDASKKTLGEEPAFICKIFSDICQSTSRSENDNNVVASFMEKVPQENRKEFTALLEEQFMLADWRNERGLLCDVPCSGLVRLTLKKVAERIMAKNGQIIRSWEDLLDCSEEEVVKLLRSETVVLTQEEIERRRKWRSKPQNPPEFIGEKLGDLPMDNVPPLAREVNSYRVLAENGMRVPDIKLEESYAGVVTGVSANKGIAKGKARVILDAASFDWSVFERGDIAVVRSTDVAFQAVLPLLGGLVSDSGGILSHAAINAREFNIPAIVGTQLATQLIPDGCVVIVDGNIGRAFICDE
jgi:phosphohistidine swiveling domain-containing protein